MSGHVPLTLVNAGGTDVTNGGALNHVTDCESLDSLILAYASRAVTAAHKLDMTTARLVAASIPSFSRLYNFPSQFQAHLRKEFEGLRRQSAIQSTSRRGKGRMMHKV